MTLFGQAAKRTDAYGAPRYEIKIDGTTYSAVMLPQRYAWKVDARKWVNGKIMKLVCEIDSYRIQDEMHGQIDLSEESQAVAAIRCGWELLKDQVRYHEEKELLREQIDNTFEGTRFADNAIDIAVAKERDEREAAAAEKRARQAAIQAERKRAKEEAKKKEEQAMIEEAGDLWGAF